MQVGVVLPQTEIGAAVADVRPVERHLDVLAEVAAALALRSAG